MGQYVVHDTDYVIGVVDFFSGPTHKNTWDLGVAPSPKG